MSVPENIFDTLVTDRTQADVDLLLYLCSLWVVDPETREPIWTGTAQQKARWNEGKGAYTPGDLNRVSNAMAIISAELTSAGYVTDYERIKLPRTFTVTITEPDGTTSEIEYIDGRDTYSWYPDDIPNEERMAQYRSNVAALRGALTVYASTPPVPPDMEGLTWQEANDIERILADVYAQIQIMKKTPCTCGASVCGGDYL